MENQLYKPKTIDGLVINKDCIECSGKDFNCKHIYMCDTDRVCVFRKIYEDMFKGNNGN